MGISTNIRSHQHMVILFGLISFIALRAGHAAPAAQLTTEEGPSDDTFKKLDEHYLKVCSTESTMSFKCKHQLLTASYNTSTTDHVVFAVECCHEVIRSGKRCHDLRVAVISKLVEAKKTAAKHTAAAATQFPTAKTIIINNHHIWNYCVTATTASKKN